MKHSTGKLPLSRSPREWIPSKLSDHQVVHLSLKATVILRSGELSRVHSDPFDRLLAAHAIEVGFALVSPDELLSALGASRVW